MITDVLLWVFLGALCVVLYAYTKSLLDIIFTFLGAVLFTLVDTFIKLCKKGFKGK